MALSRLLSALRNAFAKSSLVSAGGCAVFPEPGCADLGVSVRSAADFSLWPWRIELKRSPRESEAAGKLDAGCGTDGTGREVEGTGGGGGGPPSGGGGGGGGPPEEDI